MSGGVDSSVAAALLKKQGHDVTGVFFKPWSPDTKVAFCNWREDRQDAMRVCTKLGVPFKTWDFSKEYGKNVAKYMIEGYRAGITPNPDVMCNKEIKFGLFLRRALKEGADYIATGHYIQIKRGKSNTLLLAKDPNKDQSYFLWTLTQKQLKHCLFPIGDYLKPDIRKLAKKFGLPNYDKKDSQGVCFVGQLSMKDFLKKYIKPKTGHIILEETGQNIGTHDGVYYYTIGQRHGLDIKNGQGPYFVIRKDTHRNLIYVAKGSLNKSLASKTAAIKNINWIASRPQFPLTTGVKIRYRSTNVPAVINRDKSGRLSIKFKKPARALTPGQSAVIYRGKEMLGGGIIE